LGPHIEAEFGFFVECRPAGFVVVFSGEPFGIEARDSNCLFQSKSVAGAA